jgi:hypothetical protein
MQDNYPAFFEEPPQWVVVKDVYSGPGMRSGWHSVSLMSYEYEVAGIWEGAYMPLRSCFPTKNIVEKWCKENCTQGYFVFGDFRISIEGDANLERFLQDFDW